MPAAKKTTAKREAKPKPSLAKNPKTTKSPRLAKGTIVEDKSKPTKDIDPTPSTPISTKQPLPMPVTPQRMPSNIYTPLTRTSYNSDKVRIVGIFIGAGIFILLLYVGWNFRHTLINNFYGPNNNEDPEITQLNISPTPKPDIDKLNQLSTEILPQSSASASNQVSITQASTSAQLVADLQSRSTQDLQSELTKLISSLGQQGIDTNNLKAYQDKIDVLLAENNTQEAHKWLVEAILHATELAIIQEYNR